MRYRHFSERGEIASMREGMKQEMNADRSKNGGRQTPEPSTREVNLPVNNSAISFLPNPSAYRLSLSSPHGITVIFVSPTI
jgi:hypothetical protein